MNCKFCGEEGLEWYQLHEKWKLGIKIDVNNFRQHICQGKIREKQEKSNCPYPNRRGWIKITCECNNIVWFNKKWYSEKNKLRCSDCNSC